MLQPSIVICPGIHSLHLTQGFTQDIKNIVEQRDYLVLPTEQYVPYSAIAIIQWLKTHYPSPQNAPELSFLSFSAGVVGSIIAANLWQLQGGKVRSFVAFDGWGMPLWGNFPIYRVSHDRFTHDSSTILGGREQGFYANPEVEHLELWKSPNTCQGWRIISPGFKIRCNLTSYLESILNSQI